MSHNVRNDLCNRIIRRLISYVHDSIQKSKLHEDDKKSSPVNEIKREELEWPPSKDGRKKEINLGSGTLGTCKLMYYRGLPVAVQEFNSALSSETDVLWEAELMSKLSHPGLPYLFGICCKETPRILVCGFYGINGKAYTLYSVLHTSSFKLVPASYVKLLEDVATCCLLFA